MGGAAVHAELRRPDLFSAIAKIQENHNDSLTHSLAVWLTYHEYCPTQGDLILYFFDFFLIAWILCELVALQRSRYFRNLCEEPMCSTAWTLSFSEGWIVLFIYFCTESPLRCDGRCVFFGFFCLLLCTHLLSWPTLLYFWNNWKEKEGEITDKEKKKSWEMYLEKKLQRLKRDIFLRDS